MFELAGGEIVLWAEPGGPIMLKIIERHGDPVELAEHETEELIEALGTLLNAVKSGQS